MELFELDGGAEALFGNLEILEKNKNFELMERNRSIEIAALDCRIERDSVDNRHFGCRAPPGVGSAGKEGTVVEIARSFLRTEDPKADSPMATERSRKGISILRAIAAELRKAQREVSFQFFPIP